MFMCIYSMIIPKHLGDLVETPPLPMEIFEAIHNFSLYLILDDVHDLGRGQYYERIDHFYHGRKSPDHPSVLHHWQLGLAGLLVSQVGSLLTKGLELYSDYKKIESGDLRDMDPNIIDLLEEENTEVIPLEEYKDEVQMKTQSLKTDHHYSQESHPSYEDDYSLKAPEVSGLPFF
jgi:hypothetical protein